MGTNLTVKLRDGETQEGLILRFMRGVEKHEIATEFKKKMYYEKPSVKRKRKRLHAQKVRDRESKLELKRERRRLAKVKEK